VKLAREVTGGKKERRKHRTLRRRSGLIGGVGEMPLRLFSSFGPWFAVSGIHNIARVLILFSNQGWWDYYWKPIRVMLEKN